MLSSVLKDLGVEKKEQRVYLELLRRGPSRASTLAYQLKLPRTTVQNVLVRLEQEKIVDRAIHKNVYIYTAVHPENLVRIVQMRQKLSAAKYDRVIDDLNIVMPEMVSMMKSSHHMPSVKLFQGRDAVRTVLFDTLSSQTEIKGLVNSDAMMNLVKDINDEYVAEREKSTVTKRCINLDTPDAREKCESGLYSPKSYVDYRFMDQRLYPFDVEVNIYDGKVSYLTYVENDFVGVIIKNDHIYKVNESMWNFIWDHLPDEKKSKKAKKAKKAKKKKS